MHYNNEEVLKESGATAHYLYFILKGSGGTLLYNKNSFVCTDILYEGESFGEFLSFLTQKPTPHELRSFENSTMLRFGHKELYEYYGRSGYSNLYVYYIEYHSSGGSECGKDQDTDL